MKRSPLRIRRPEPRRKAPERVKHRRTKPKAGAPPTAEEKRYWNDLPNRCEGCGTRENIVVHHLLANAPGKRGRRDHWFVVKLCATCHNIGTQSVHGLGSEARFAEAHGVDLVAVCVANLNRYLSESRD